MATVGNNIKSKAAKGKINSGSSSAGRGKVLNKRQSLAYKTSDKRSGAPVGTARASAIKKKTHKVYSEKPAVKTKVKPTASAIKKTIKNVSSTSKRLGSNKNKTTKASGKGRRVSNTFKF